MIDFQNVTFAYQSDSAIVIKGLTAHLHSGEFNLVVGKTGSGKSTFLNLINGTAPHLTGGLLAGEVTVFNMNTKEYLPRDFAEVVGVVSQDPRNSFVTSMVQDELAYSMECLGVLPKVMRQRLDETVDLLGLAEILHQPLEKLSAGQQQRVAIGSVLVNRPKVLVLDEPTSALDPVGAEEVLSALQRLVDDLGVTVVAAEHRLERVLQFADKIIYVPGAGNEIIVGSAAEIMNISEIAPPIVELAKALNWTPLPITVKEARRFADPLIQKLTSKPVAPALQLAKPVASVANLTIHYGSTIALQNASLQIHPDHVTAVLGRNGAGKSTLLAALAGLIEPTNGSVLVTDKAPKSFIGYEFLTQIGLVPQEPADLLLQTSVNAECDLTDKNGRLPCGTTKSVVEEFLPDLDFAAHPLDLSEGQRLLLVLALIMTSKPKLLLLDEPTRGLDYGAKAKLLTAISKIKSQGTAIVIATHDVELVAELEANVVVLADGKIITQGPAREVLVESISFSPQITRAFAPLNILTMQEAVDAIKLAG